MANPTLEPELLQLCVSVGHNRYLVNFVELCTKLRPNDFCTLANFIFQILGF